VGYFEDGPTSGEVVILMHGNTYGIDAYIEMVPLLVCNTRAAGGITIGYIERYNITIVGLIKRLKLARSKLISGFRTTPI
jgi:hypothetical protein